MLESRCCECGIKLNQEYDYGPPKWCFKCSFKEAIFFNIKFFGTIAVIAVVIIIINLVLG